MMVVIWFYVNLSLLILSIIAIDKHTILINKNKNSIKHESMENYEVAITV